MKSSNTITSLPPSPADDRHGRMVKYSVAMGVRIVCLVLCFAFPVGWWTLLPILGAVLLPYYAVVLANVGHERGGDVEAPSGVVELYRGSASEADPTSRPAPFRPTVVGDDEGPRGDDDNDVDGGASGRDGGDPRGDATRDA